MLDTMGDATAVANQGKRQAVLSTMVPFGGRVSQIHQSEERIAAVLELGEFP